MTKGPVRTPALLLFLIALTALGCASSASPPRPVPDASGRPVVVIVPGMTGSLLCSGTTGEVVWGSVRRMIFPWDGGYRIALPLDGDDDVVPCGPIREMRIGSWRKDIYGGLISFLEGEGYAVRFFDHDWRRDNLENAEKLAATLEQSAERVQLICQSNATYICRWAIRYGGAAPRVDKLILVGTANGGALRILREMNHGRRYVRLVGRRFRPEIFFTMPSIFQDLPVYKKDLFADERGSAVGADLFDPAAWEKYEWSVFAPAVRARIDRSGRFGTPDQRRAHLAASLMSARRMHDTLRRDSGTALPPVYSIQSVDFPTIDRAMIRRGGTLFSFTEPGDVHATRESQEWLSEEERAALAEQPVFVSGKHFEMITTAETRAILLRILRTPGRR
ncbi:MAG TPA: hypothetical protein VMS98_14010 [Thermoanaerobaculia bacterium]|nr:hypothetical protein [Thermoanaerobaculia bacterium]